MDRLGLWGGSDTPFGDFDDFRRAVESRGVGMMELVAMHLKQRGALVSRALSFKSCTFELVNDVMTPSLCSVLVLSWRWRLRGITLRRRRLHDRQRVYASREGAAAVPRRRDAVFHDRQSVSYAGTWSASTTEVWKSGTC